MKNPFNIKEYLSSQGINFKEEGENISQDSIGICCPSCGDGGLFDENDNAIEYYQHTTVYTDF